MRDKAEKIVDNTVGVYMLKKGANIVYIGASQHLKKRILSHIIAGTKEFDDFDVELCSKEDLFRREAWHISINEPKYNKMIPRLDTVRKCTDDRVEKRIINTCCQMRKSERRAVEAGAELSGMTLSEYIRDTLLKDAGKRITRATKKALDQAEGK